MTYVKTIDDTSPVPRGDGLPFTLALFQEAPDVAGVPGAWTTRSTITLATGASSPASSGGVTPTGNDPDPAAPMLRDITTTAATIASGGWYRIVWQDAATNQSEGAPVQDDLLAAPNLYATSAELKATLSMTGETFADADIALALSAASRGLDRALDSRFFSVTETRRFTPVSRDLVFIGEVASLTTLEVDEGAAGTYTAWVQGTDYVLEPLNALADGIPFTSARRLSRGRSSFPGSVAAVRVTGAFGWPQVPAPIKEATVILASRLVRRAREAPFGVIAPGIDATAAMHIARTDPDIRMLTASFDRTVLVG